MNSYILFIKHVCWLVVMFIHYKTVLYIIYIMYWIIAYKKQSCTLLGVSGKSHLQKYCLFSKMKIKIQMY